MEVGPKGVIEAYPHRNKESRGFFISFEGTESSGKTTQAKQLRDWLESQGFSVILTREPGGTPLGEEIRSFLLDHSNGEICPLTEAYLFAAARAQLVMTIIRPALEAGTTVICDRYIDSSLAYQGYGLGVSLATIWKVNEPAIDLAMPDLTFLLGSGALLQSAMKKEPEDRIEARDSGFHQRVRAGYVRLMKRFPQRIVWVDTRRGVAPTACDIQRKVAGLINL